MSGALHSVCPQESTSVMDVPGDGETREMECYVGKSVDEVESGVSMSVAQLFCILGKVNRVLVNFLVDKSVICQTTRPNNAALGHA